MTTIKSPVIEIPVSALTRPQTRRRRTEATRPLCIRVSESVAGQARLRVMLGEVGSVSALIEDALVAYLERTPSAVAPRVEV